MKLRTKDLVLASIFAALTAIGAFIKIPVPYVPFTLQFLFCAFSGLLLGSKLGALSQVLYVGIGLIGVPVFTAGGGPSYIFQPTFGYLIGFIACAFVVGKVSENIKRINVIKIFATVISGLFCLYLIGVPYLYLIYNLYLGKPKILAWALYYGFATTVGGDILLSLLIAIVATKLIPILRSMGYLTKGRA